MTVKTFLTEYRMAGPHVVGELMAVIPVSAGMTPEKADAIVAALNGRESGTVH